MLEFSGILVPSSNESGVACILRWHVPTRDRCSGSFWRHVMFGVAIWSHAHDIINGQDLGQSVVFKWDGCIWVVYWIFHIFISVSSKKKTAKFPMWGFLKKVFLFGSSIHFVQIVFSQSPTTEFPETNRLLKLNPGTSRERMLVCQLPPFLQNV